MAFYPCNIGGKKSYDKQIVVEGIVGSGYSAPLYFDKTLLYGKTMTLAVYVNDELYIPENWIVAPSTYNNNNQTYINESDTSKYVGVYIDMSNGRLIWGSTSSTLTNPSVYCVLYALDLDTESIINS